MGKLSRLHPYLLGVGILLWIVGWSLQGIGLVLASLILWVGGLAARNHSERYVTPSRKRSEEADGSEEADDEPFHFDLSAGSGWNYVEVYPSRQIYERVVCYGGPPETREIWEYQLKHSTVVFERLQDRCDYYFGSPEYEVVNNQFLGNMIDESSPESLAATRRELAWRELDGALKYFILSRHFPQGEWWKHARKLKHSFTELEGAAKGLGAIVDDYGDYNLPDSASQEEKTRFNWIFSPLNLRRYHNTTLREWRQRDQIIAFLDEADSEKNRSTSTHESHTNQAVDG